MKNRGGHNNQTSNKEEIARYEENVEKLESENRLLVNNYHDLVFQLEELEIENEFYKNEIADENGENGENDLDFQQIEEMKQKLYKLRKERAIAECKSEYTNQLLKEHQEDLKFLQMEVSDLENFKNGNDEPQALMEMLEAKKREVQIYTDQLSILLNEEKERMDGIRKLDSTFRKRGQMKPLTDTWRDEKSKIIEKHQQAEDEASRASTEHRTVVEELENTKASFFENIGATEEEIKKAIFAEINYNSNEIMNHLQESISAEVEERKMLQEQLERIRATTVYIKNHRDELISRQKKQFELASSRKRLQLLQNELDRIHKQ